MISTGRETAQRLLVFTRTTGYRHGSLPVAVAGLHDLVPGLAVETGDDPSALYDLRDVDVVCFLSTSGDVLDDRAREQLREFVEAGGGFVGVHSALGTEPGWDWFGDLLGARFAGHPDGVQAAVLRHHPATPFASARAGDGSQLWHFTDEWYALSSVRGDVELLLSVDEATYRPGRFGMPGVHPQAWRRAVGRGRSWVTALGHTVDAWHDRTFLDHVASGLAWAAAR